MSDDWSDSDFLAYCEAHSETERALFHYTHIARCFRLAGYDDSAKALEDRGEGFVRADLTQLVTEARRLRAVGDADAD